MRDGIWDGPLYASSERREWNTRGARSGGRAHSGRYEAVVQGMELPDVGVEIGVGA